MRPPVDMAGFMRMVGATSLMKGMTPEQAEMWFKWPTDGDAALGKRMAASIAWAATTWGMSGFPLVVLGHRLASSLMATNLTADAVEHVAQPWPAYAVKVPQGLVRVDTDDGKGDEWGLLVVHPFRDEYACTICPCGIGHGVSTWTFASLADALDLSDRDDPLGTIDPDLARRLFTMASRLIVGAAIELDQECYRKQIRLGPPAKNKRVSPEPKSWIFQLTRDVKVDCREYVSAYLAGNGTSPSVQCLVRGHHKRQVCGPGRSERKWIHIEPYWRGPEDAPIAVRSHVVSP